MGKHVGRRQSAEGEWKRVPALSKPWPLLLKCMELAGTPGEIKITKSRVLIRGTSPQTAWMGGHARKSPWRKRAGLALASFGLLCLLFLPIGASNHNVKAVIKAPKPTIDLCGLGQVKDQLLGLKPLTSVKLGEGIRLGGVMAGTFTCKNARYRYALGLTKPERILSVTKLDT